MDSKRRGATWRRSGRRTSNGIPVSAILLCHRLRLPIIAEGSDQDMRRFCIRDHRPDGPIRCHPHRLLHHNNAELRVPGKLNLGG